MELIIVNQCNAIPLLRYSFTVVAIRSQITNMDSFSLHPSLHDLVQEKLAEISWLEDYLADPTDTVEQDFVPPPGRLGLKLSCYLSHLAPLTV